MHQGPTIATIETAAGIGLVGGLIVGGINAVLRIAELRDISDLKCGARKRLPTQNATGLALSKPGSICWTGGWARSE